MNEDDIAWMWLGQGSFAFRLGTMMLLIDPYLSDAVELQRICLKEVSPHDIDGDYIIVTHDHLDHFDPETVAYAVREKGMTVIGPESCFEHYEALGLPQAKFIKFTQGDTLTIGKIELLAKPAEHPSGPKEIMDAIGLIIKYNGRMIYHVGDSELTEEMISSTEGIEPDYMFVPINGKWGNMNAAEAASLSVTTEAKYVIPMHYGMFAENTADPNDFVLAMDEVGRMDRVIIANMYEVACITE